MSDTLGIAAHEYRRTIGKHEFSETYLVILDLILWASLERRPVPRLYAIFPLQKDIAEQRGIDEGDCSRALKWLVKQKVIEIEGCRYMLLPPPWTVPVRVEDSEELRAREAWLERVEEEQSDLLPPDKSLNEARREVFVESSRDGKSVESKSVESAASSWTASKSSGKSPVGFSPTGDGRVGENPSPPVGENPTRSVASIGSIDPDRLIDSRSTSSRSPNRSDRVDRGFEGGKSGVGENPSLSRDHVMAEMFAVIGEHERFGRSASHWHRCAELILDDLDELTGVLKDLERVGRAPGNKAAWMMTSSKNALMLREGLRR